MEMSVSCSCAGLGALACVIEGFHRSRLSVDCQAELSVFSTAVP